jgi:PAS domain S-box-containing protein
MPDVMDRAPSSFVLPPELLGKVLQSAPDAIVIVDGAGRILFANKQVSTLFGYTVEDIAGQNIETLIPERLRVSHHLHRHTYAENVRVRAMGAGLELFARHKDGSEFPVEVSLSPVGDSKHALVAAAIRDVTERKKIQQELLGARESADRANEAKSRFLATASHDLRQPLQTLFLLNGALRRTVHDSAAQEILQHELQAIDAMARLLNALLDISKLESGAIKPDLCDFPVAALFDELRNEFAAPAESKGLELRIESAAAFVRSDAALVGQILRNFLSNAIKYTRKGWVALRCAPHAATLRIEVADTGVGMAADQLPLIYDEFYRIGVSRGGSQEGYGLGLSIVHRLAALLHIRLEVQSEVGRGSVFAIELPLSSASEAAARSPAVVPAPGPRKARVPRILLVEDDAGVRDATRMLLTVEGYQVIAAASLAEAVDMASGGSGIDLVVTDYHLGREDTGVQVIDRIREIAGANLGAILMTGDTSATIRELEPHDRLSVASKPIDADELLRLIEALLPD